MAWVTCWQTPACREVEQRAHGSERGALEHAAELIALWTGSGSRETEGSCWLMIVHRGIIAASWPHAVVHQVGLQPEVVAPRQAAGRSSRSSRSSQAAAAVAGDPPGGPAADRTSEEVVP